MPTDWSDAKRQVEPLKFFDHYESVGWVIAGNPIKSWQATIRKWIANDRPEVKAKLQSVEKSLTRDEAIAASRKISSKYD